MYPLIPLGEGASLPTYFLSFTLAYTIGLVWVARRSHRFDLPLKITLDICLIIMIGGFLGSRVFHILWEHPDYYLKHPWAVFRIWQGGFVFYGGVIGALVPIFFYMRHQKEPWPPWLDLFAPVAALTYALGRLGTFLSGSGYGSPTSLPWGVVYPSGTEAPAGVSLHPTQLYAATWELLLLLLLLWLEKNRSQWSWSRVSGSVFYVLMVGHGLGRLIWEQFRDDFRGQLVVGLSVSSWLSLGLIVIGAWHLLAASRQQVPGSKTEAEKS